MTLGPVTGALRGECLEGTEEESSSCFGEVVFERGRPLQCVDDTEAVRDDLSFQLKIVEECEPCSDGDEFNEACRASVGFADRRGGEVDGDEAMIH